MRSHSPKRNLALSQTAVYFISVTGFGAVMAAFGPILPTLAEQVHTSIGHIGLIFTVRSLGFFLGSLLGGRIFDRLPGHPLLAASMLLQAVGFALFPLINEFWLLLTVALVTGVAGGMLLVGSNTLVVWVHPDNVGPWMNGVSFFSGAGGFLSPIFITAFLAITNDLRWAFWTLSALMAVGAIYMFFINSPDIRKSEESSDTGNSKRLGLVLLFALIFLLYVGTEVTFSGWISTITKSFHPNADSSAALLTSAFWGAVAAGRLLAIPISSRARPRSILIGDFLIAIASLLAILTLAESMAALWIGTILFGLSMASLFPTLMAFADRRVQVDGKVTGIIFSGTAIGGMVFPWLTGLMFDANGPSAALWVIFSALLLAAGIFGGMTRVQPSQNTDQS